jgi:hypothetical protein
LRSKELAFFIISIVAVLLIAGCTSTPTKDKYQYGHYNRDVKRDYADTMGSQAINKAENINYTKYFNLSRWYEQTSSNVWANYIDAGVLKEYNDSYTDAKNNRRKVDISYSYYAVATYIESMDLMMYNCSSDPEPCYKIKMVLTGSTIGNTSWIKSDIVGWERGIGIDKNGTMYNPSQNGTYHFSKVYCIDMKVHYSAFVGPLAGLGNSSSQVIILDKDLNPMFIFLELGKHMIS